MRRLATILTALLFYDYHIQPVKAAGLDSGNVADIHGRYGTAVGVQSICYTYVTTLLVTVEPNQETISRNDGCTSFA